MNRKQNYLVTFVLDLKFAFRIYNSETLRFLMEKIMSKQKVSASREEHASQAIPSDGEASYQYCSMPQAVDRVFSSDVDPNRQQLILVLENKWLNGTVLHYYFFDQEPWKGSEGQKNVVREAFKIWKNVGIGLEFKEVSSHTEAEIRIGFMQGDGSWSGLGRDILNRGINERTMNFGWDLTRNSREIDTAIHEIGHTLGFPHEHQNPNAGIVWDEEKVYANLAQPPNSWPRERTFYNIIRKLEPREVEGSTWDPNSVMHYPFGPGLIKAPPGYEAGIRPPGGLSAKDREYVLRFYPPLPEQEVELRPFLSIPLELGKDRSCFKEALDR